LTTFIGGCRPKTQAELFSRNVTNLEEAITLATTLETIANAPRMSEVNYVKINNSTFSKKPHGKSAFQGKCNKCQKIGHKEADCYANRPRENQNRVYNQNQSQSRFIMRSKSKDLAQIECHKCHKKGHYASNCGKTASAYTYKPTHKANIVEVNMIQIIEPVLRQESDDEK
jgi:hypothetical protein